MSRKRVRTTSKEQPPTAAVTTTNTWPWSATLPEEEERGGEGER